jgi:hypothetical protein
LAAGPPRQVIGDYINTYRRKHQDQGDPETPIAMRAFPVWAMVLMNNVAIRVFLLVAAVFYLSHCFPAFSIPFG